MILNSGGKKVILVLNKIGTAGARAPPAAACCAR